MLTLALLRNEGRLLGRHPLVWLALAGVAAMSGMIASGSPVASGSTPAEAVLRINLFIPAFLLPFLAATIGPIVFLREVEHDMREIVGSYPPTAREWLAVRLAGCLALLLAACVLAQAAMLAALAGAGTIALPMGILKSLGWLVVIHLPACLIWTCLLARLSSATAHAGVLYFAAGFGWVAYIALASLTGSPLIAGSYVAWEPLRQALLLFDPYAITALTSPVPDSGVLQSRVVTIAAGRVVWLLACLLLLRGIAEMPSRVSRAEMGHRLVMAPEAGEAAVDKPVARSLGWLGLHLRYFLRDRVFPLLVAGWLLLLGPEVFSGLAYAEPLAQVDPDSRDALNRVMWDVVPIFSALLLLYSADRVCRMFPSLKMHELVAATPYRSSAMMAVQVLSLWAITILFTGLAALAVAVAQLAAQSSIEAREYLYQFGLALPPLLMLATVLVAIHALVRVRFAANLANVAVVLLGFTSLAPVLGLHHPLWRPFATPLVEPDHYWGFDGGIAGYIPFAVFWLGVSIVMMLAAMEFYHRDMAFGQLRWRKAMRSPLIATSVIVLFAAAIQGRLIHSALAAEGELVSSEERQTQRATYERLYSHWSRVAQPDVASVRFDVDFDPAANSARLGATMTLVNRSRGPIEMLLVGRNQLSVSGALRLSDGQVVRTDKSLGQTVFRFDQPLMPDTKAELTFTTRISQSGLVAASMPLVLRRSFSSIPAYAMLPLIGYRRELTLRDPEARREQGLPDLHLTQPSRLPPPATDLESGLAILESVISTAPGQHAIGPGELIRTWQANGRAHFLYRSAGRMRNLPAFFSVPWHPQTFRAGQTAIVAYAPGALAHSDPNLAAIRDTLELLGRSVALYPSHTMRALVVPEVGLSGYALPQTALLSHRLAVRSHPDPDAGFNQAYRRAAHETAHQWFGHRIGYGILEEHGFLVESLAKYAELVVIERRYGKQAMRALVAFELDRYRDARLDLAAPIAPLVDAEESEDMYSRATLVFACLRQQVGDKPILGALRHITAQSERTGRPARSLDFVDALTAKTGRKAGRAVRILLLERNGIESAFRSAGCDLASFRRGGK